MCCLLASPELFWWWLITFVFLTRTFCHKTTHANCYYGAWPGWAVSVSVLPLRGQQKFTIEYYFRYNIFEEFKNLKLYFNTLVNLNKSTAYHFNK